MLEKNIDTYGNIETMEERIAKWAKRTREAKKKNALPAAKINELESIQGWKWDIFEGEWEENFNCCKIFKDRYKKFPNKFEGNGLGTWCSTQRKNKKKGLLPSERITKLESIGFQWEPIEEEWWKKFNCYKLFIDQNKRLPSIYSKSPKEKKLGAWCSWQKRQKKKGRLSSEKINKLESLSGWKWKCNTYEEIWLENFNLCKTFKEKNKKFPSAVSESLEEKTLGNWCRTQRDYKNKGALSHERIKKLESIKDWKWDVWEETWEEHFNCCKLFKDKNKRFPSPGAELLEEKKLGEWCSWQRQNRGQGHLPEEKIAKLELIGFQWDVLEETWKENFNYLKFFKNKYKKFPNSNSELSEEKKVGSWCSWQRKNKKKGNLSPERILLLESIPGWTWEGKFNA